MDAVTEIKDRLAIEDVIGEYIELKRAGHNYRGLSPFSNEKTPSFMVSPEKQIWHDFSSNKGGNMFSFVMEMEGVDFKGALEILAKKASIDLSQYSQSSRNKHSIDKSYLSQILEQTVKFYQAQLRENKKALNYVIGQRKFSKPTILLWQLGYSPNTGTALVNYLSKKGYTEKELKMVGLVTKDRSNNLKDMFRGRLMIPLHDAQGNPIGFTARQLDEDNYGPKYINTPQTVLYDKGRHVYGLHLAKGAIREMQFAVITEGNLDVIASHQAGIKQVVATAGTAMTDKHLKIISNFATDIRLCFDADKAGVAATERAVSIASRLHLSLNIIDMVGGKDPDELIKKDPKLWQDMIERYAYAINWLIDYRAKQTNLSTAEGKRFFTDSVLPIINNLDDEVEKDHYLNLIAKKLDINKDALIKKSSRVIKLTPNPVKRRVNIVAEKLDKKLIDQQRYEDNFLSIMICQPSLRYLLELMSAELFTGEVAAKLFVVLTKDPEIEIVRLQDYEIIGDYVKIQILKYEELYRGLDINDIKIEADYLKSILVQNYVKQQKLIISQKLTLADEETTQNLLSQAKQLDKLLKLNLGEYINAKKE